MNRRDPTARFTFLISNYVLRPLSGAVSVRSFWYTPDRPVVHDEDSARRYLSMKIPHYVLDYRPKLAYRLRGAEGIIVLPYPKPIGHQQNPLASFMYALGAHDRYLETGDEHALDTFFAYASHYLARQRDDGLWSYDFDWLAHHAPWFSALAQSHGASVMLRAWLHTSDERFRSSALAALAPFGKDVEAGGLRNHLHRTWTGRRPAAPLLYYEEAPKGPLAVVNGLMAALIGPYECGRWLGDERAEAYWAAGLRSLPELLRQGTLKHWTMYSLTKSGRDLNSPHYHQLQRSLAEVLIALADSSTSLALREIAASWARMDSSKMRAMATIYKAGYRIAGE